MIQELTAGIPYTVDTGEKLVNETFGPNNIRRRKTGTHDLMPMSVRNGRLLAGEISLEQNGFVLVEHKTKVGDFFDSAQLESVYYPEVEQLIKQQSGASRVVIFDHTLRSGDEAEREAKLIREPVMSAHNDYTEWSGPNRVREFLPDEAEDLLTRRFAIIQVWRAINQPIQVQSPCAGRRQERRDGRSGRRRAPLPAPRRADLSIEVQRQSSLVLFSRNAPRRGARVQSLRFQHRRPRPLHAAHLLRRPQQPGRRAGAAKHRSARFRVL